MNNKWKKIISEDKQWKRKMFKENCCTKTGRERSCYKFSCAFRGISRSCAEPFSWLCDKKVLLMPLYFRKFKLGQNKLKAKNRANNDITWKGFIFDTERDRQLKRTFIECS